MKYYRIIPFLIFIPVIILQINIVPLLLFNGIYPDLILILLVYYTIQNNQIFGTISGFIFGGLYDLIFGTILGSMMLTKTLSGFLSGYFSSENKRDIYLKALNFSLIIFLIGIIDKIIFGFFSYFELSTRLLLSLFTNSLFGSLYTSVLSFILIIFLPNRRLIE